MNAQQVSGCAVLLLTGLCLMNLAAPAWRKLGMGLIWS